jgi:hypothetical protein
MGAVLALSAGCGWPALAQEQPAAAPRLGEDQVRFRTAALMIASIGGTALYGRAKWWQDGIGGSFRTVNEGWFGRDTAHGGADKLGHAMFAYTGTRLLTRAFEWAGNEPDAALKLAAWTAVGTLMGVEVVDGHSKKWGFSKEDALLNLTGGALGWWLETHPAADALLDLRVQYSPSMGPQGRRSFNPFGDYSGLRYLLVFKASGMPALREQSLLRYVEFQVGYGARNFETESRALVAPTRHVYYGVSLNLSEVLRSTVFDGNANASRSQRLTETALEYVQVPAAAITDDRVLR